MQNQSSKRPTNACAHTHTHVRQLEDSSTTTHVKLEEKLAISEHKETGNTLVCKQDKNTSSGDPVNQGPSLNSSTPGAARMQDYRTEEHQSEEAKEHAQDAEHGPLFSRCHHAWTNFGKNLPAGRRPGTVSPLLT